jgi:hypothetical protein
LLLLWACSSTPDYSTQTPPQAQPSQTVLPSPGDLPVLRMPGDVAPPGPRSRIASDSCGAVQMQSLVGRPRSLIPVPLDPNRQRVACTTCPAADDTDPTRLNFLFDPKTGLIRQIRCG